MSRLTRILNYIEGRPEIVIEVILAITLVVFAIYLGGPWYVAGPTTVLGNTIEMQAIRILTAVIYFIPGVITLFAIKRPKLRMYGAFGLFMAYLFTTILRVLTVGFTPLMWVFTLALALVMAVCYIVEAKRLGQ